MTINQVQGFSFAQELGCMLLCNHFGGRWENWKLGGELYHAFAGVSMFLINSIGVLFSHIIHNVKFV